MERIIAPVIALLICAVPAFAITIYIPGNYPTIQEGINAAVNGDTVLVAEDVYYETIDYLGKEIVVKSVAGPEVTTIEWDQPNENVVTFYRGEGPGAVIEGFTITNSYQGDWAGGGVYCGEFTAPVVRSNIIVGNGSMWSFGGGIYAVGASPLIEQNQIMSNEVSYTGAGIWLQNCTDVVIIGNTISENYTWSGYGDASGCGIYATNSTSLIEHNLILYNTTQDPGFGGGIALAGSGYHEVKNNTFSGNSSVNFYTSGGGIYIEGTVVLEFSDNILVNSPQGGGISIFWMTATLDMDFNDVWNNLPVNYFRCSPGRFDISLDPEFVGGSPYSYELTENSPCIDAGSFTDPLDPDGTRKDMGAHYFDQEGMNIAIVPDEWPIVIPAIGGSFSYTLHLTNHTANAMEFDVWVNVLMPDSTVIGPLLLRQDITFDPDQQLSRNLIQNVPGSTPEGTYFYMAYTGDYPTSQIFHEAIMPFEKEGSYDQGGEWIVSHALDDLGHGSKIQSGKTVQPSLKVSPNPFNPTTTISLALPQQTKVLLSVCDVNGRLVATLVDGYRSAGMHNVTFNASQLPSGVYLYRLEAGDINASGKMVLVK